VTLSNCATIREHVKLCNDPNELGQNHAHDQQIRNPDLYKG